MMGRLNNDQGQLFYSFCLEEVVPDDHLVRSIAAVLDLSWVYGQLRLIIRKLADPRSTRCVKTELIRLTKEYQQKGAQLDNGKLPDIGE
jgi:hypothetical protein